MRDFYSLDLLQTRVTMASSDGVSLEATEAVTSREEDTAEPVTADCAEALYETSSSASEDDIEIIDHSKY